jgi:Tat protein secretion system quality control protein TatD with DNase activity
MASASNPSLQLPFADSHTHLQDTKPSPLVGTQVLDVAVVLATNEEDWDAVLVLCQEEGSSSAVSIQLLPALGVHPWYLSSEERGFSLETWPSILAALREKLISLGPAISVGEIGLDKAPRALAKNPWDVQLKVFRSQLALAAELNRSVSLHCVRCSDDILKELEPYRDSFPATSSLATSSSGTHSDARTEGGIPAMLFHSFGGAPHVIQRLDQLFPQPRGHPWAIKACSALSCAEAAGSGGGAGKGKQGGPEKGKKTKKGDISETAAAETGPITRVLISFQGSIVAPVVEAYHEACCAVDAIDGDKLASIFKGGASKQTMSVLASLPYHQLCFETDAPYQPFAADYLHPSYRKEWRERVLEAMMGGRTADLFSETPPDGSTGSAGVSKDSCCGPADDAAAASTSGSDAAASEVKLPPQTPARVVDVIIAAATWRVLKNCRPKGAPSAWWPPAELVAEEAVLLTRASASNVLECFSHPYGVIRYLPDGADNISTAAS